MDASSFVYDDRRSMRRRCPVAAPSNVARRRSPSAAGMDVGFAGIGRSIPAHRRGRRKMADVPVVVGINRTQDGSIAVARGRSTMYSLQKERISRRKHHWGRLGDLTDRYLPYLPVLTGPVDLVVEGFSSDTEIDNLDAYRAELRRSLHLADDAPVVLVS